MWRRAQPASRKLSTMALMVWPLYLKKNCERRGEAGEAGDDAYAWYSASVSIAEGGLTSRTCMALTPLAQSHTPT